jgi:polynucleotide 5'-kinase involved in rRNA processing
MGRGGTGLADAIGCADRVRRHSTTLAVGGPDGSGKSSLAAAIVE